MLTFSPSQVSTPSHSGENVNPYNTGFALASGLHLSSPSPSPSQGLANNTPLNVLASTYPAVAQLSQEHDRLLAQHEQLSTHVNNLYEDLKHLREENKELKLQSKPQPPTRMAELLKTLEQFEKPARRPEDLPFDVLWAFEDTRADECAAPSNANPSRPNIEMSIRGADGQVVPRERYKEITATVNIAYRSHLEGHGKARGERPTALQQLRRSHSDQVKKAVVEIESTHPEVALCAFHWKAYHLLQHHIQVLSNSTGRKTKKASARNASDESGSPTSPNATLPTDTQSEPSGNGTGTAPGAKRKGPEPSEHSTDGQEMSDMPPPPKKSKSNSKTTTHSSETLKSALELGGTNVEPVSGTEKLKVNTAHISVNPSYENVRETLLGSPEYAKLESVLPLLDRLKSLQSNPASAQAPNDDVLSFISQLESADPNSPDLSEDDDNAQWGHYQFTAGGMTLSKVLTSWDAVGDVPTACRLLAAAIKTHRVAEAVCFQRSIHDPPSMSLTYLGLTIEQMWKIVENVGVEDGGEKEQGPGNEDDLSTSLPASRENVSKLSVAELTKWIDTHGLATVNNPRPKRKNEIIDFIVASGTIPTTSYIAEVVRATQTLRKPGRR